MISTNKFEIKASGSMFKNFNSNIDYFRKAYITPLWISGIFLWLTISDCKKYKAVCMVNVGI